MAVLGLCVGCRPSYKTAIVDTNRSLQILPSAFSTLFMLQRMVAGRPVLPVTLLGRVLFLDKPRDACGSIARVRQRQLDFLIIALILVCV